VPHRIIMHGLGGSWVEGVKLLTSLRSRSIDIFGETPTSTASDRWHHHRAHDDQFHAACCSVTKQQHLVYLYVHTAIVFTKNILISSVHWFVWASFVMCPRGAITHGVILPSFHYFLMICGMWWVYTYLHLKTDMAVYLL